MLLNGKYEYIVMHMLYVCVLYISCGSSQCCIMHDLQFFNAGRGCKRRPYGRGDHMEEATIWKRRPYGRGDHMDEAYSRVGIMTAL